MTKVLWAMSPVLAVVAVWGVTARRDSDRQLQITGGQSGIAFYDSILKSNRLELKVTPTSEGGATSGEVSHAFKISGADLRFTLVNGRLARFDGGKISHSGGFQLRSGRNVVDADQFMITPSKALADGLQLWVDGEKGAYVAFDLVHLRPVYHPRTREMVLGNMDLQVSLQGAQALGRPELAGQIVGALDVVAKAEPIDHEGEVEITEPQGGEGGEDATIDVSISAMGSLTAVGRVGTFPNGRNGFSMSTTSCNVGTANIPWFAPMNVQHPVIAMNLYRLGTDGQLEQIGWSWLKHGFFATNSSGCGSCQSPGTGTLLGPGCSDTYGVGNNGDRFYLGGRDEVNPLTGVWTCQNSYFSNYVNDCVRRNNGSGLDSVAHRLEVHDADLNVTGATYFYEAYYINANDFDRYNNIASRQASIQWGGSSWSVNTTGAITQGPVINRWGDMRSFAEPRDEGDVIVAVKVTSLGGGMYRYDYAAYNHTLDRQVRQFSIPVPVGATIQNVGVRDIDKDPGNEWAIDTTGGKVTWATGTEGSGSANPLKYSSMFNFRFDCDVPPANSAATLGMFKSGNDNDKIAAITGPLVTQPLDSYELVNAVVRSGNFQSLAVSDNDRLVCGPEDWGSRSGSGIIGNVTAPDGMIERITVGVESSNTLTAATQKISLWNWQTGEWEQIDSRPTTQSDSKAVATVSTNAARFVDGSGHVKIQVLHLSGLGDTGNRWTLALDQVGVKFN